MRLRISRKLPCEQTFAANETLRVLRIGCQASRWERPPPVTLVPKRERVCSLIGTEQSSNEELEAVRNERPALPVNLVFPP